MLQMLDKLYLAAQSKLNVFLTEEQGDVNIVSMVVLIGIAVILAIIFRDAIESLITSLLGTITNNAQNAIANP